MEIRAGQADAVVRLETGGDLRGKWDPDRLAQVVSNLIGNERLAPRLVAPLAHLGGAVGRDHFQRLDLQGPTEVLVVHRHRVLSDD